LAEVGHSLSKIDLWIWIR